MPLSLAEIKQRAITFSRKYREATDERRETQSFYNDFFEVFGLPRRRVAVYEKAVDKLDKKAKGFIDLFWPGTLLIEQKSAGRSLTAARKQALEYCHLLPPHEIPRYLLISDFRMFELVDLDANTEVNFTLETFPEHIQHFGFISGYQKQVFRDEAPVNIKAAQMMGAIHDELKAAGYTGHHLELLLVRLLFCMFADDTGIFDDRDSFRFFIENFTGEDGANLGPQLAYLFQILNTKTTERQPDPDIASFPYVNGNLFAEVIPMARFNSSLRNRLLECCRFDWSQISPAVFGSLFQSVMDGRVRRNLGAHYTTERNILKTIHPLFLDELKEELTTLLALRGPQRKSRLEAFQTKLGKLTFLDPACGCGNFLILAYRELRMLELEVLQALYPADKHGERQAVLDLDYITKVNVDQFYGIEVEEFPARIAEVAMWLVDHQMNRRLQEAFGIYYKRLPLKKAAKIVHANALELDWASLVPPAKLSYILGNPPFIGKTYQNAVQKADIRRIFGDLNGAGNLDYVSCWYVLAARMMQVNPAIRTALVSTNSITQGEQVGTLWGHLMQTYGVHLHFAHRTFAWTSEATGAAAVHVVIVGFGLHPVKQPILFEYATLKGDPHQLPVASINPYLVPGAAVVVSKRDEPLADVPTMRYGSKPADGGHLICTSAEKAEILRAEPKLTPFIRPYINSDELLNGEPRYCFWLKEAPPEIIHNSAELKRRIEGVRTMRAASTDANTRKWAEYPSLFQTDRQPKGRYLGIPEVSSENRDCIPMKFLEGDVIASNLIYTIEGAALYHFGVLSSATHTAWMRTVGGRLKSDYRYSNSLVYNTFPWPKPTKPQQAAIEKAAEAVLAARAAFPHSTLAALYDRDAMPPALRKAHQQLDAVVDKAYRAAAFPDDHSRLEHLFTLYQTATAPLVKAEGKTKRRTRHV